MNILPVLLKDGYKVGHKFQYPDGTTMVYSNLTPRGSRVEGIDGVIVFGIQYFVTEYLIDQFQKNFFSQPKEKVLAAYKRRIDSYLGPGTPIDHIAALHDLGYLPLQIKALPEGTLCPFRVPVLTIRNTQKEFFWLTNMLETLMSNVLWQPMTSATTAFGYRRRFQNYAQETGAPKEFVPWQGHDFSFRGLSGVEAACLSGAGHLLSFTGTDTIPAIDFLEQYYGADCEKELIGGSVPATEHSVMCMGLKAGELQTFRRLITEVYPRGIVSIVSDTWDFWKVLCEYLPALRSEILAREGKVVIRPDSGDPVKIICGDRNADTMAAQKGAVRLLYETFGGTKNDKGYIELDPHIGLIYGDSITPERQTQILEGLKRNGYASSNVVLGIGSYTYQYVTRDTFGFAMKATYGEISTPADFCIKCGAGIPPKHGEGACTEGCTPKINIIGQAISKDPKTDNGVKRSASGLLCVVGESYRDMRLLENQTWEQELGGLLDTVFLDGQLKRFQTLSEIRKLVESQL